MAPVAVDQVDRRHERRQTGGAQFHQAALLRPGQPVLLVNISSRAALVESGARLRPGARTELQLARANARTTIRGRLDRCHVSALEPLRYRGVLVFDERLELQDDEQRVGRE